MSVSVKLIISLVIAAIAASIVSTLQTGAFFNAAVWVAFATACVACALLGNLPAATRQPMPTTRTDQPAPAKERAASSSEVRENGKVKWFNVAKGFGFIIRENGEEIFVHFRAIQGNSRRGLRDGQAVSFVVKQSDKGPQAEEVLAGDDA